MITKDEVIELANAYLAITDPRARFNTREENAPVIHALVGALVDLINAELAKFTRKCEVCGSDMSPNGGVFECGNGCGWAPR